MATGQFQTDMLVEIANDGPVTVLLDSKSCFNKNGGQLMILIY